MTCPDCKADNAPDALFCSKCGKELNSSPPASKTRTFDGPPSSGKETSSEFPVRGDIFAGRYDIIEELGSGGMGKVYRVFDKRLGEEAALKLLRSDIAADRKAVERFRNEIKVARKIGHAHVCRMYDLYEEDDGIFITMEYVPGEDLKSLIRRAGALSVARAVELTKQIGEGLAEAHRLGVVHRDLKPQNIMIDRQGRAKIMDFGIARRLEGPDITAEGMIIGTPDYMAPEQVNAESVDARTDIYALGLILYEMLTSRLPFEAETGLAVALKHKTETPLSPRNFNPQLSEALERLILKCLSKQRDQRFASASEFLDELTHLEKTPPGEPVRAPKEKASTLAPGERECINSIAVLPFKDLSPGRDQDYFCEGLAEELINALAQVKGLSIAARTSSFSFKGKEDDIREIGRRLDVGSILEGSVQKSGNRLRITAQLICVSDGYHLWSERYDRSAEDIFSVQDEIAMSVVEKLKGELLEGEKEKLTKRHTENREAYHLFLKGRWHWNRRSPKDMIMAVDHFQRAIDMDQDYALAYVGIADVFNMLTEFGFIHPREGYRKSRELLRKARELDDDFSELFYSLAQITYCYEWDLPAAERYARRSIELNPRNMWAHSTYGELLASWGRMDEALEEAKRAIETDPFSSMMHAFHGIILTASGRVDQGRESLLKAIAMEEDQPMFNLWLGMMYLAKPAEPDKAVEHLQLAAPMRASLAVGYLGVALAVVGRKEEALKCLAQLDKIAKQRFVPLPLTLFLYLKPGLRYFRSIKKKYVAPYLKAMIYFALGRQEEAFSAFEKSVEARDWLIPALSQIIGLFDLPWVKEFTESARYQAIKAKINTGPTANTERLPNNSKQKETQGNL